VKRAALFTKLIESDNPVAVETELSKIEQYCKDLNSVEKEFVTLKTANILLDKKSRRANDWVEKLDKSVVGFSSLETRAREITKRK
jgi:hypothetical protein